MHPDWQIWLDAIYVAVMQSGFPADKISNKQDMLALSNLIGLLSPNTAAQLTAATIFCCLRICDIQAMPDQQKHEHFTPALDAGEYDAVFQALSSALMVCPPKPHASASSTCHALLLEMLTCLLHLALAHK